jgi:hypothetical protein
LFPRFRYCPNRAIRQIHLGQVKFFNYGSDDGGFYMECPFAKEASQTLRENFRLSHDVIPVKIEYCFESKVNHILDSCPKNIQPCVYALQYLFLGMRVVDYNRQIESNLLK